MSRFESGMESMLDMYIYESVGLLEQLDDIMMKTESNNKFDDEDINEIFRIMHTIKGSSAMMGLENMSTLAHSIEDMFFIIRENKPVIECIEILYEIVFSASDLLKAEIDALQDEDSVPTDFSEQMGTIESFVVYLKTGNLPESLAESRKTQAPPKEPIVAEEPLAAEEPQVAEELQTIETTLASKEDNKNAKTEEISSDIVKIRVFFDDNCEMENLRALLLVNKVVEYCSELKYEPADIETDPSTSKIIVENGFLMMFKAHEQDYQHIYQEIEDAINVKSYELVDDEIDADSKPNADSKVDAKVDTVIETKVESNDSVEIEIKLDSNEEKKSENISTEKVESEVKPEVKMPAPAKAAPTPVAQTADQINSKLSAANKPAAKSKQNLISVNRNKLDQLLDMVGEIVIAEAMVASNPDLKGLKLDNFQKAARQLRKLTDELQDIVMSIRMVPLSGVFNKMIRIVRDMKIKLNKDVELVFEGEETEVDKSIIDSLNEPLMHMVRNSMDHGIEETAAERIANGKSPQGTIMLSAYNSSGEVIIVVSDDGGGIDCERVLKKASENGLLTRPEEEYTPKEIYNMVMLPGFSTNVEVTEFSGRGVGMDVVKKSIEKIGGTFSVDSKPKEGTNFIIKIPLSLAIIDGIEVSVGPSIFTIPINVIKEFIKLKENQVFYDTSEKEIVKIRNKCYPLIRLHEFYSLEPESDSIYDGVAVLVEAEGRSACILVDELIGEQQVVVKPFSPMFNQYNIKQQGMAGCTILGDGSITIILDISNIILDS